MSLLRYGSLFAIIAMVLSGCETTPEPDPTLIKLNDVDERLGRVERVVNNQSLLQLSQRIDALEAQLREMRGALEELQNGNESLGKQQRDLYADLEKRLVAMQAGALAASGGGASGEGRSSAGALGADSGSDQSAYSRAFDALKNSDYPNAITRFKDFLRSYPQSNLAGNAVYWLGETYYLTRDLDNAAASFRSVGEQYPKSPKVPDALVKLGITQTDQKKLTEARATLTQVVQRYPGTEAAKLASSRLQNLPPDAH
jgi:tol-pal system protein YbgF